MAEPIDEAPEEDVQDTLDQASPAAVALALGRTRRGGAGKGLDAKATAFLEKQTRLIELQTEHLHEQRELMLSHMRWRRFSDRMKALLQVMTAGLGLLIACGVAWMAWSASQQRGLVIDPFTVPAELAQRGYDGRALAARFLDRVRALQAASQSVRSPMSFRGGDEAQLKLEIPETGVSLDDLQRFLARRLGHVTHVSGQLQATGDALALSVANDRQPEIEVSGPAADVNAVVDQAADQVYAQSEPYRYARYLGNTGHTQEALARYQALAVSGDDDDRRWALQAWGQLLATSGDLRGAAAEERRAAAENPDFPHYWANLEQFERLLGHDQAALEAGNTAILTYQADHFRSLSAVARAFDEFNTGTVRAELLDDYSEAYRLAQSQEALLPRIEDQPGTGEKLRVALADAIDLIRAHDLQAADRTLGQIGASQALLAEQPAEVRTRIEARRDHALGLMAADHGDWASARAQDLAALSLLETLTGCGGCEVLQTRSDTAVASARAGDVAGAEALIAPSPADCYACLRARAQVAEAAGDRAGADRGFAEALQQGPSLPGAETDWGRALLARGDPAAAIGKLAAAHAKSPTAPDPLELWGEALMRQRDYARAAAKFAAADKSAPRWGGAHLRWGEALMLSGRYAGARAQYEIAAGLDLSRPDRAALNVLLARTASGPLYG